MRIRQIALALLVPLLLCGGELLEIEALSFNSDEKKGVTTISGDVHIKHGKDWLNATKVLIYTDKNHQPTRYEAFGVKGRPVTFHILFSKDTRKIDGRCQRLVYDIATKNYEFYDNALLVEEGKQNSVKGDKIILSKERGYADVVGNKKLPAKLIFTIEDKDKKSSQKAGAKADASPSTRDAHKGAKPRQNSKIGGKIEGTKDAQKSDEASYLEDASDILGATKDAQAMQSAQSANGAQSLQGMISANGAQGSAGAQNLAGAQGSAGTKGVQNMASTHGSQISQGIGAKGIKGSQVIAGAQGIKSAQEPSTSPLAKAGSSHDTASEPDKSPASHNSATKTSDKSTTQSSQPASQELASAAKSPASLKPPSLAKASEPTKIAAQSSQPPSQEPTSPQPSLPLGDMNPSYIPSTNAH